MYTYPYPSRLRVDLSHKTNNIDYRVWQSNDIQSLMDKVNQPVVEIGGPTQDGFYFLDKISIGTRPIITNISQKPLPYSPNSSNLAELVTETFDATNMPYKDSSIGVFLMSAMSVSSDWWTELAEHEKEKISYQFETEFANARFEMGQVAAGILRSNDIKDALRVKIYREVTRCLAENGLFFTDGGIEEIIILKQLGFELVACLQVVEDYGLSYEFVVAKRF